MHRKSRLLKKLSQMPTKSQARHKDWVHCSEDPTCPESICEISHNGRKSLGHAATGHQPPSLPGKTLPRSHSLGPNQEGQKQADAVLLCEELCNYVIPIGLRSLCLQQLTERQRHTPGKVGWPLKKLESPAATSKSTAREDPPS